MPHPNARTTVHGRMLIVQRHQAGWPQAHIAAAMGISRKCVKTWIDRYAGEGQAGLSDRSSRPHHSPRRTPPAVEEQVLAARIEGRQGQDQIAAQIGIAARTVGRILRRHRIPHLRLLDPITGEVIKASKATTIRYERDRPGELVHMDVKKIGRIPDGGGWRVHGRPHREATRDRTAKVGYDYVHSLVDDHSRLAYCEVLPDEKGATCAAFLRRAVAYFTAHGITAIQRLMTDNAWAYRWSLRSICTELGIRQKFIKPHCPWQNGKAERLNRTLVTEWAYRRPYASNTDRTAALASWLEHYNNHRPHTALAGRPPINRLLPTS